MKFSLLSKLLISSLVFQLFSITALASFSDVGSNHEANDAVAWMELNGIVEGYENNEFRPAQLVNRAEFLKMLYETLGDTNWTYTTKIGNETFSDLPTSDFWFQDYISQAYATGVVDGYPDGTFKPENTINFAEAAKIVGNAFFDVDNTYADVKDFGYCAINADYYTAEWYWRYIGALDQVCIFPDSVITKSGNHPSFQMTRSDVAIMLYKAKAVRDNSSDYSDLEIFSKNLKPNNVIGENEFTYRNLIYNSKIGNWTVNDKAPYTQSSSMSEKNLSAYLTGEETISGEYYYDEFQLMLSLDEESKNKVPKYIKAKDNNILSFGNETNFTDELTKKGTQGTLTVKINKLFFDYADMIGYDHSTNTMSADILEIIDIQEYDYESYNDVEYLCTSDPIVADNGRTIYPIATKYEHLEFLGQLFTADDCGEDRINSIFGVENGNYTLGSNLSFLFAPKDDFVSVLQEIGYKSVASEVYGADWSLSEVVPLNGILKLKAYYDQLYADNCTLCG